MNTYKENFGNAIKKRRSELGITQEKLAELSKLHRTYIADIERGVRNVSLENILKIIKALDLSNSDFFTNYFIETRENNK
jgi:transcriptional regulator with XRE-family HTH domain